MAQSKRTLEIEYGDLRVGGNSSTHVLTGVMIVDQARDEASLEFEFVVTASTEGVFADRCQDVEDALREPYLDVIVRNAGSTLVEWRQSENTGLDAQPTIVKRGVPTDTVLSRTYRARIVVGRPADWDKTNPGLRDLTVDVSWSASRRRTVTISGTFTSIDTNSARDAYEARSSALTTSIMTALGVTNYELAEEPRTEHSVNDKTIEFVRVVRELLFSQAGGTLDTASIVEQSLSIERRETDDWNSGEEGADNLTIFEVRYEASVDAEQTTDLATTWGTTIFPWVMDQVGTLTSGSVAVIENAPRFDYDENRISARVVVLATATPTISIRITVEDDFDEGNVILPVWFGSPFAAYRFDGAAVYRRTITETKRVRAKVNVKTAAIDGRSTASSFLSVGTDTNPHAGGNRWIRLQRTTSSATVRIGLSGGNTLDATDITVRTVYQRIRELGPVTPSTGGPGGSTGGGGGGSSTTGGAGVTRASSPLPRTGKDRSPVPA